MKKRVDEIIEEKAIEPAPVEAQAKPVEIEPTMQEPKGEPPISPTEHIEPAPVIKPCYGMRCINCYQHNVPISLEERTGQYTCPVCKHVWTVNDEQSPFRKIQRGEKP